MPKTSKSINLSQYADALNAAAAFKSDFNSRAQVGKKIEIVQMHDCSTGKISQAYHNTLEMKTNPQYKKENKAQRGGMA